MPRWTGFALVTGLALQLAVGLFLLLVVRSQATAQDPEIIGEASQIISDFTRSVDVFNFVVVASFVGFAASLWAILKINKADVEARDKDRAAYLSEAAAQRVMYDRNISSLQGMIVTAMETTTTAIEALVGVGQETDKARASLEMTGELIKSFMDTTIPALVNAHKEADLARHDRDSVVAGFRQSTDVISPKLENVGASIDTLIATLRTFQISSGKMDEQLDID